MQFDIVVLFFIFFIFIIVKFIVQCGRIGGMKMLTDEQYTDILNSCGGRISIADAKILYQQAMNIAAKNIVEIGSKDGCSSMVLGEVVKQTEGHVWCIEPFPTGKWSDNIARLGLTGDVIMVPQMSPWFDNYCITVVPIDFLFIDGDHRTRWTLVDYHFWEPYVRPGGLIAFHDWTGAHGVGEWVQRAVSIILEDDELEEVARHESNSRGIIVFRKPEGIESFSQRVRRS